MGEIGEIVTGSTPPTANHSYYDGNFLFVTPADIQGNRYVTNTLTTLTQEGFLKGRKIPIGASMFVCIGSTIGKVAQTKQECTTNQQINSVLPIKNNNDFVFSLLEFHSDKIKLLSAVQAVPIINKTTFSNYYLNTPSLPEQQKIASFFTSIDQKISQLKRKLTLLEQYKKGVMQKIFSQELRFKDDNGQEFPKWEKKKLGDISKRMTTKNIEGNENVLTISAQHGLISQLDFFNKSVAAINLSGYYLLKKDDFAYNKSYSAGYPMGAIKRLKLYDEGVVSTLYICFTFKADISLSYIEHYFESGMHNREIEKVAQEGARNHGLLNIGVGDFFNTEILLPTRLEQTRIANFLSAIDDKINHTRKQIEKAEVWKKGLMQQMFC